MDFHHTSDPDPPGQFLTCRKINRGLKRVKAATCIPAELAETGSMAKKKTSRRSTSNTLNISLLTRKLKSEFPSLAVIVGKEDLLRREARDQILAAVPGGRPDADTIQTISAQTRPDETRIQQLFDDLLTPSLFGGIPIVILEGADRWLKTASDAWLEFLPQAQGNFLLILISEQLDGRSKLAKSLKEPGWWVSADRPFHRPPPWRPDARPWDNELNQWLVHRFGQAGLKVDAKIAQIMIDRMGPVMAPLAQTVEKLSLICTSENQTSVSEELLVKHLPGGGDGSAFDLVDRWFEKKRPEALLLLSQMLEGGWLDEKDQRVKNPQALLLQCSALALKRARELRAVRKIVEEEKGGEKEILEQTTLTRPFLPKIRLQYKHCDAKRVDRIIAALIELDWQMKSGAGARPEEMLERAILSV